MNRMNDLNVSLLRNHILLFAGVALVCGLLLWFSFSQLTKQQQIMDNAQTDMSSAEEEIENLNYLVSLFDHFSADYNRYVSRGFLDDENRLSWIETLDATANQLSLDDLRYQVTPRQQAVDLDLVLSPSIKVFESTLTLETGLAHEGDLVTLTEDLYQLKGGLFVIDHCKVERVTSDIRLSSSGNFQGTCTITSYTASYDQQIDHFMEEEE
jgi:hypothetical protein